MIFQKYTIQELLILAIGILLVSGIMYLFKNIIHSSLPLGILFSFVFLHQITFYFTKKIGVSTLFFLLTGITTFTLPFFSLFGSIKLVVLFCMGLLFEILYLFISYYLKQEYLSSIISITLVFAALPVVATLFTSPALLLTFFSSILNVQIIYALIALVAGFASYLLWFQLKQTKFFIKLQTITQTK